MCDLNPQEQAFITDHLAEIAALATQLTAHGSSIATTAFMDHEGLASLLATLSEQSASAARWVAAKPQEHAGHGH